jgi:hypothetical protein
VDTLERLNKRLKSQKEPTKMLKLEKQIKNLIEKYVDGGNEKYLDQAEKLYNENQNTITMSWETLVSC